MVLLLLVWQPCLTKQVIINVGQERGRCTVAQMLTVIFNNLCSSGLIKICFKPSGNIHIQTDIKKTPCYHSLPGKLSADPHLLSSVYKINKICRIILSIKNDRDNLEISKCFKLLLLQSMKYNRTTSKGISICKKKWTIESKRWIYNVATRHNSFLEWFVLSLAISLPPF